MDAATQQHGFHFFHEVLLFDSTVQVSRRVALDRPQMTDPWFLVQLRTVEYVVSK